MPPHGIACHFMAWHDPIECEIILCSLVWKGSGLEGAVREVISISLAVGERGIINVFID